MDLQEGDGKYCASELLEDEFLKQSLLEPHTLFKSDVFSLGLSLTEIFMQNQLKLELNGSTWHSVRNNQIPWENIPCGDTNIVNLLKRMTCRDHKLRPSIDKVVLDVNQIELEYIKQQIINKREHLVLLKNSNLI